MGGGDLNMKKSWHTGTFQNQERVWKKEQEALAERKKLQQLQKELEQERAVQELQRLQREAGGHQHREDRVEWMYAAPAEGNGPNAEELEQYLLGKKRVDQLLRGNEEKMMAESNSSNAPGASSSGTFTASSTANSARDTAAKIREDPLLAIKRQEQLQYEKMLKDPKRLKMLRDAKTMAEGGRTPASSSSAVAAGGRAASSGKDGEPDSSDVTAAASAADEARNAALAARLASMQQSAQALSSSRTARLSESTKRDAEEERKDAERLLQSGRGGDGLGPRFMRDVEKGVFGGQGGVGERIKRSGKVGLVGDRD
ncbi:hypothetical protein JCM10212_004291 [Sporobolomyces blumeae]